jgi:hypothetical protein
LSWNPFQFTLSLKRTFDLPISGPDAEGQCFRDKAVLLNSRAAALNQNDQHDDKENTGNYPDDRGIVHLNSPFFSG